MLKPLNRRSLIPVPLRALGVLLMAAMAGCAAYGGAPLLDVATDVTASRGVKLQRPVAIKTTTGTRFHGLICRGSTAQVWNQIRVERLGAAGGVVASAAQTLPNLTYRGQPCAYYDVATDWTIGPAERVRVCAVRFQTACGAAP